MLAELAGKPQVALKTLLREISVRVLAVSFQREPRAEAASKALKDSLALGRVREVSKTRHNNWKSRSKPCSSLQPHRMGLKKLSNCSQAWIWLFPGL